MNEYEVFFGHWWIFPVVMVILYFLFMRRCNTGRLCGFGRYSRSDDSSLSILRRRLAKGEIDVREFEEKKNILESH